MFPSPPFFVYTIKMGFIFFTIFHSVVQANNNIAADDDMAAS